MQRKSVIVKREIDLGNNTPNDWWIAGDPKKNGYAVNIYQSEPNIAMCDNILTWCDRANEIIYPVEKLTGFFASIGIDWKDSKMTFLQFRRRFCK